MKYTIQFREKVTRNTDPQRRCYDGCHFSSVEEWSEWQDIRSSDDLPGCQDSVLTFQRINPHDEYRILDTAAVSTAPSVQFGELQPDGKVTNIRILKQSDISKCPHCIMVPEHYREDGTCKCNDPAEQAMMIREWGYKKRDFLPKKPKYNVWEEMLRKKH